MAAGQEFVIVISIFLLLAPFCTLAQSGVRGPPQASQKEDKKVGRIGENIKLTCPIVGFPTPMVEWYKNGEKIDYMWERHKTSRKSLKIKHISEDDTGVFTCKGINGFGSEEVRIELIVVDPRTLPQGIDDSMSVAPPTFTFETKMSQKVFIKNIGDTFKVSCEALGSPEPEIFWFKDGQHIDENVHYQGGKSTVEFSIFGKADSGVYTCRARNLIGQKTVNFTLEVEQPQGSNHAVVTEVGPVNTSVFVGEQATLQCRIKSLAPPHIKWLKKMEPYEEITENTLNVGPDRYKILRSNSDVSVSNDEYLNKLVIERATLQDAGLYICFVTNSGFGDMTYKSMVLRVQERPTIEINVRNEDNAPTSDPPTAVLILVIGLFVVVFILLLAICSYVCAKKHKQKREISETQSSTDCSEVERPFMHPHASLAIRNNNFNKPLPPTPMTLAQWSNAIYPKVHNSGGDSGFTDPMETTKENFNTYEVPYAHLIRPYRQPEDIYFTQEAFINPRNYSRYGQNSVVHQEFETQ